MKTIRKLNRIRSVLRGEGRSNKWLADQLGVHVNTVSKWLTNEQQPHVDVFYDISQLLNCDLRDLFVSTKPKPKKEK